MTAMRLKRYPSAGGGISLGKMGVGATMLKQGKTARDYVQNGLVAMWDGIENAGWGVHDANATTWKDLVGGVGDCTIYGTPNWSDDALACLKRCFARSTSLDFSNTILSGTYTVEILIRPEPTGVSNGGFISTGDNGSRVFWIWERNANYAELIDSFATAQGTWNRPSTGRTIAHLLQFSVAPTGAFFAVDGVVFQTKTTTSTSALTAGWLDIGRIRVTTETSGYIGNDSICRCSLYSRALTADEIAANYAIDKERFNLP